jgi:glutamine amidotransferase
MLAADFVGLGLFEGEVVRLARDLRDPKSHERLKVPHMGFGEIRITNAHPLLSEAERWFYFVHSLHGAPDDPDTVTATARPPPSTSTT